MLKEPMVWTAISYNWSAGLTSFNIFSGAHSHSEASQQFADKFPGENLLALVAGSHNSSTEVYPLLTPHMMDEQEAVEENE